MPNTPGMPNIPVGGLRQQRAAQLKAEMEAEQQEKQEAAHPAEDDTEELSAGPVGQGDYRVKQGDCISSIAKDKGHFWETIWNDPGNAELKSVRKDPNVLLSDDRVAIPEIKTKQEPGETEMRHRFVRLGEPAMFRIRFLAEGEPRGNEPYTVEVDGEVIESGTTTPDGSVEFPIPGDARQGLLKLGEAEGDEEIFMLDFGNLAPITEVCGVQQRLHNLGYPCGPSDNVLGERTKESIRLFQRDHELDQTGNVDEATRAGIQEAYGT